MKSTSVNQLSDGLRGNDEAKQHSDIRPAVPPEALQFHAAGSLAAVRRAIRAVLLLRLKVSQGAAVAAHYQSASCATSRGMHSSHRHTRHAEVCINSASDS